MTVKMFSFGRGAFEMSSGDPWTYIAARPLHNWSEWHGGELSWVKAIEIANWPALVTAIIATEALGGTFSLGYLRASWVRAVFFAILTTLQWLSAGFVVDRAIRKRRSSRSAV
ncbi:MAG: hypothetical protein JJE51_00465 [Thermoanaerobaculia bacterium]|nr:hypothetical protein [Thermoanaerobaculia bacterium]